jgi:hypothetical protein
MRRMLHCCTSSVRLSADGKLVYAPVIAPELEFQLDEWYSYLPRLVYFERDEVTRLAHKSTDGALEGFLQTQYYVCKTSIYWPAVYQAIEFGEADEDFFWPTIRSSFIHTFNSWRAPGLPSTIAGSIRRLSSQGKPSVASRFTIRVTKLF